MKSLSKFNKFFEEVKSLLRKPELLFLPGQLAFSLVFSIIPALSLLSAFASKFNVSLDFIYIFVEKTFSVHTAEYIVNMFATQELSFTNILVIIIALVIASNGFNAVIISADQMYGLKPTEPIKRRIKSFFLTAFFFVLLLFILIVPVFGNTIVALVSKVIHITSLIEVLGDIFTILKWPITVFLIILFIKLIYTLAPDKVIPSKFINRGSIFTTFGFSIVTVIYAFYVNNIARYDMYYGNFSNLIILLLWLYLMSYIFVFGLALNEKGYKDYIKKQRKKSDE